jgi:hypothetical protein
MRVQRAGLAVANVHDVASGHHQATVGVKRHPADTAAPRHDGLDLARRWREVVHAAAEYIGEVDAAVGRGDRRFGQGVSAGYALHAPVMRVGFIRGAERRG